MADVTEKVWGSAPGNRAMFPVGRNGQRKAAAFLSVVRPANPIPNARIDIPKCDVIGGPTGSDRLTVWRKSDRTNPRVGDRAVEILDDFEKFAGTWFPNPDRLIHAG